MRMQVNKTGTFADIYI